MRKETTYCDVCGNEFNSAHGFRDYKLSSNISEVQLDICVECYRRLRDAIVKTLNLEQSFVNRETGKKDMEQKDRRA